MNAQVNIDRLKKPLAKLRASINIQVVLYKVEAIEVVVLIEGLSKLVRKCSGTDLDKAWILLDYILD